MTRLWLLLGFAGTLTATSAFGAWWLTSGHYEAKLAALRLQQVEAVARANAEANAALVAAQLAADEQVAAMQREAESRRAAFSETRKDVLRASNSKACVDSPPVRALLDGLRREGRGARGAAPGAAASRAPGAAGVRPPAGSPYRP